MYNTDTWKKTICWTESEQNMNIIWVSALLVPRLHWAPCMSAPLADFFAQLSTNARTAEVAPTGGCRKCRKNQERSTMKPTIIKLSSNYHLIHSLEPLQDSKAWSLKIRTCRGLELTKRLTSRLTSSCSVYHHHCDYHWNFHSQQTLARFESCWRPDAARACASSEMCRFRGTESDT